MIAERMVIGIVMNHPDWLLEIKDLKSDFFYNSTHEMIFRVMENVYNDIKGDSLDAFMLLSYIKNENIAYEAQINKSGGLEYLKTIQDISADYSISDLKNQADIVKTLSFMRDIVKSSSETIYYVENGEGKTIEDVKEFISKSHAKIMEKYTIKDSYCWLGDIVDQTLETMEISVRDGVVGYPSKIAALNKYVTYRPGELVIFGARAKYLAS